MRPLCLWCGSSAIGHRRGAVVVFTCVSCQQVQLLPLAHLLDLPSGDVLADVVAISR